MGKEALVVKREVLFGHKYFQGFIDRKEHDFISTINSNFSYHPRGEVLEMNPELQQIIPYVWILNPQRKQAFLYKRVINGNDSKEFKETRYLNKYSGGVGGHIDRDTEEGSSNPIEHAMMRELREEVVISSYPKPEIVGFLNDEGDSLGRVHFGLVAIAKTTHEVKTREGEGLAEGKFYSIHEIDHLFKDPENQIEGWTKLSWPFVKNYLERL